MANFRKECTLFVDGVVVELTISGKNIAQHVGMALVKNFADTAGKPIRSTVRSVCSKTIFAQLLSRVHGVT